MKRRLIFNVPAACSLVICLASLALWCREWYAQDLVFRGQLNSARTQYRLVVIRHTAGRVVLVRSRVDAAPGEISPTHSWVGVTRQGWTHQKIARISPLPPENFNFKLMHWRVERLDDKSGMTYVVGVRLLPLAAVTAVLPLVWLRRELSRRRRVQAGHCLSCGYDLRASPERCPECGALASIEK